MSLTVSAAQTVYAHLHTSSASEPKSVQIAAPKFENTNKITDTFCKVDKGAEREWTNKNGDSKYRITSHNGISVVPYIRARNCHNQPYANVVEASKILGLKPETERCGFLWLKEKPTGRYNFQEKILLDLDGINLLETERSWLEWDEQLNGFVEMYEKF